jgi:hypothetical protein
MRKKTKGPEQDIQNLLRLHTAEVTYGWGYIRLRLHTAEVTYDWGYIRLRLHTAKVTYGWGYIRLRLQKSRVVVCSYASKLQFHNIGIVIRYLCKVEPCFHMYSDGPVNYLILNIIISVLLGLNFTNQVSPHFFILFRSILIIFSVVIVNGQNI